MFFVYKGNLFDVYSYATFVRSLLVVISPERLCFVVMTFSMSLRKHAYSNILKILPPKNENFQMKNSDIFHISAQNIHCGFSLEPPQRGGSNEYPQSMF